MKCTACGKAIDSEKDGVKLWETWFCSLCFMSRSQDFNREIRPEEVELLKMIGRELSGLLPPDLVEMVLVSYWKRTAGQPFPPKDETLRVVGELQRLAAFAVFRRMLSLLKTWQDTFNEFIEQQQQEIQENVKKLTS